MSSMEWLLAICIGVFLLCVIGGMVKFVKALGVLMKGRPAVDEELAAEQAKEDDLKNHE